MILGRRGIRAYRKKESVENLPASFNLPEPSYPFTVTSPSLSPEDKHSRRSIYKEEGVLRVFRVKVSDCEFYDKNKSKC